MLEKTDFPNENIAILFPKKIIFQTKKISYSYPKNRFSNKKFLILIQI